MENRWEITIEDGDLEVVTGVRVFLVVNLVKRRVRVDRIVDQGTPGDVYFRQAISLRAPVGAVESDVKAVLVDRTDVLESLRRVAGNSDLFERDRADLEYALAVGCRYRCSAEDWLREVDSHDIISTVLDQGISAAAAKLIQSADRRGLAVNLADAHELIETFVKHADPADYQFSKLEKAQLRGIQAMMD